MQKNNDDARRHLLLRLRLGTLPAPLAATASAAPYVIASTLILGFVIVGLFLRPPAIQSPPPSQPILIVTPPTLDFDKLKVGQTAVRSVIIKTNSDSKLRWKIVSGNAKWLGITQSNEIKGPDNLREVIYDVTANTSKLHEGKYTVTYNIDAGGVKDQQVQINIQVIPPSSQPSPAKLNVNPLTLDFDTQNAGSQMTKLLTVSNSGQMDLNWRADRGNTTWLTLDKSRGRIAPGGLPQVIKVKVDTTTLTAGQHTASIKITSNGGDASVSVVLLVGYTPTPVNGPIVSSISPTSGPASGGATVTIMGSGFTGATGVSFGSTAATIVSLDSDAQITAISPTGSGTVHVTVTTPGGASATSASDLFIYIPRPIVTGISPKCELTASGATVTITGSGFTGATNVSFGTTAATSFKVGSDIQITAIIPTGSGTVDVTVTTPGGTSAAGPTDQFAYPPRPTMADISPRIGPASGGTSVTITGSNFTCATSVWFGTTAAPSFTINSDTQITAVSPAGSGTVDVKVTTPGGTSDTNLDGQFTYLPPPIVKFIMPINGPVAGGTSVAIFGSLFTGATSISFGATAAPSFKVKSDTLIIAISPAGSANNTVYVTVTTPGGTSATNNDDQFTYLPRPTVTGIDPKGDTNAGGKIVTITGTGFTYATMVSFGLASVAADGFTVISDTKITIACPPANKYDGDSVVDVTVTTPGGTSVKSSADQFTYGNPIP